jgi:hypothetical protein
MQIPVPLWLVRAQHAFTRMADHYSDWASQPTGPNLRIMRWRYRVLRRDWVSIAQLLLLGLGYAWWTSGGAMAFGIGIACGILMWIAVEAYLAKINNP